MMMCMTFGSGECVYDGCLVTCMSMRMWSMCMGDVTWMMMVMVVVMLMMPDDGDDAYR